MIGYQPLRPHQVLLIDIAHCYTAGPSLFSGVLEAASMSGASSSAALLGLKLAVDVMVVACPCALGLATPTAVLVASSMGAQRGLLLRGGDVLERMAHINVVAFDKTGTLTQVRAGCPSLAYMTCCYIVQ